MQSNASHASSDSGGGHYFQDRGTEIIRYPPLANSGHVHKSRTPCIRF